MACFLSRLLGVSRLNYDFCWAGMFSSVFIACEHNGPVRWSETWLKNTVPAGLLWEENTVAAGSALCSCESNQPAGAGLQTSEHEQYQYQ